MDVDEVLPAVYTQVRAMAQAFLAGEQPGHTLRPSDLAQKVYENFAGGTSEQKRVFQDTRHFMLAAAEAIRCILIDHARAKKALKRGGGGSKEPIQEFHIVADDREFEFVSLNDAIERFEHLHPRAARVVKLKFFAGATIDQIANLLDVATSTVSEDWTTARAWLRSALREESHLE